MHGNDVEEVVEEVGTKIREKTRLALPRKFKVFLLNDDYTPMDFVVEVLQRFFYFSEEMATMIMLQVHTQGKGLCGIFSYDIAETKVAIVNAYAREHEFPLLSSMEPE